MCFVMGMSYSSFLKQGSQAQAVNLGVWCFGRCSTAEMASGNFVEDKLILFSKKHSLYNSLSSVDEIVLDYVSSILEDIGSEDEFAVEEFIEMMDAYIPGFMKVERDEVCQWIFQVAEQFKSHGSKKEDTSTVPSDACALFTRCADPGGPTDMSSSKVGDSEISSEAAGGKQSSIETSVCLLLEMFPASCQVEVRSCLSVTEGDIEQAAQLILDRQESGESELKRQQMRTSVTRRNSEKDDSQLKEGILQKYSYIDTTEDVKEHRPLAPKEDNKKRVRYIGNQVVSTRGERYVDMRPRESEEMKKTYINLKPARQYRFH
ncbi:CUE domain-containing protein 2-A-like isoform X2 [Anneissia japonica]|uniref:CUE domain-containing protein 2-A-like isoform X2 n=1 Tax=Anneissia japonica TaxID=1529436 RepID=UPI0014258513|nr:CUE domain-containing protein 2-A-like isoform X2 [Anneissia japonica]